MTSTYATGETAQFALGPTFGVKAPKSMMVEGFVDNTNPFIPKKIPYVFRKELLRDMVAFLQRPRGDGLHIFGPLGGGKTSLVKQVAARLNWPVQEVTARKRMELSDLIGTFKFVQVDGQQEQRFVYGPASIAVRDGHLLIINEMDLFDPGEIAGLNAIRDGGALVIPENGGEVIHPHPKFRLIATTNSTGHGDDTGLHPGVLQQNIALLDGFRVMQVGYMEPDDEQNLLQTQFPELPEEVIKRLIKTANEVRRLFIGDEKNPASISITLSSRALMRWAGLIVDFRSAPNPIQYALDRTELLRARPEERTAVVEVAKACIGELWDSKPVKEAPATESSKDAGDATKAA